MPDLTSFSLAWENIESEKALKGSEFKGHLLGKKVRGNGGAKLILWLSGDVAKR